MHSCIEKFDTHHQTGKDQRHSMERKKRVIITIIVCHLNIIGRPSNKFFPARPFHDPVSMSTCLMGEWIVVLYALSFAIHIKIITGKYLNDLHTSIVGCYAVCGLVGIAKINS